MTYLRSVLLLIFILDTRISLAGALDTSNLAGVYERHAREAAARIILFPDRRFRYEAMYGATDAQATGMWTYDGKRVRLKADYRPARFDEIRESERPDRDASESNVPISLTVNVISLRPTRITWEGIQVSYRLADGSVITGRTSPGGASSLRERKGKNGERLEVKAVGLASTDLAIPPTWHQLTQARTRTLHVHLDPGKLVQAFERVDAKIETKGKRSLIIPEVPNVVFGNYVYSGPAIDESILHEVKVSSVNVKAVSHLPKDEELVEYRIGGRRGEMLLYDTSMVIPDYWHPRMHAEVAWAIRSKDGMAYFVAQVPIERYAYPESLYLHIFPQGRVRLVVAYQQPESDLHPVGKSADYEASLATVGDRIESPAEVQHWRSAHFSGIR